MIRPTTYEPHQWINGKFSTSLLSEARNCRLGWQLLVDSTRVARVCKEGERTVLRPPHQVCFSTALSLATGWMTQKCEYVTSQIARGRVLIPVTSLTGC